MDKPDLTDKEKEQLASGSNYEARKETLFTEKDDIIPEKEDTVPEKGNYISEKENPVGKSKDEYAGYAQDKGLNIFSGFLDSMRKKAGKGVFTLGDYKKAVDGAAKARKSDRLNWNVFADSKGFKLDGVSQPVKLTDVLTGRNGRSRGCILEFSSSKGGKTYAAYLAKEREFGTPKYNLVRNGDNAQRTPKVSDSRNKARNHLAQAFDTYVLQRICLEMIRAKQQEREKELKREEKDKSKELEYGLDLSGTQR